MCGRFTLNTPAKIIAEFFKFTMANSEPFAFAGLWENWRSPEGQNIVSCSIITTAANETVQPVHDRMPVILPSGDWEQWLDPSVENAQQVLPLLKPYEVYL